MSGLHQYTFIPATHAGIVNQAVAAWKAQSQTAFVCLSGWYQYSELQAPEEGQFLPGSVPDQLGQHIPQAFFYQDEISEAWLQANLDYYVLEGALPAELRALAESLNPACLFFKSIQEIRAWQSAL